jgi:hypothetical protein
MLNFNKLVFNSPKSSLARVVKCSHEVIVSVEEVFLLISKSHLAATVLRKENSVALFHGDRTDLSIIECAAWPNCDDHSVVQLVLLALRKENSTLGLGEGLGFLDEDAVHQRTQFLEGDH